MTVVVSAQSGGFTQDKITVAMPSVNNNFLKATAINDVNLYTGVMAPKVSLLEVSSRSLKFPVSLSYTGGMGIRVQEVANYVGLGWRLNAGGSITRLVRGLPDEFEWGFIGVNTVGAQIFDGASDAVIKNVGTGSWDGEPDLFTITTPWFSERFVMDKDGNPVFSKTTGLTVTHNLYKATDRENLRWTVKDDKGNTFTFGTTAASREKLKTKLFDDDKTFISTWYLDQITAINSYDVINFEYLAGNDYSYVNYYKSQSKYATADGNCSLGDNPLTDDNVTYDFIGPKYLSSIVTASGKVSFSYVNDRRDVTAAWRLDQISLLRSGYNQTDYSLVNRLSFLYSYFGDPSTDKESLRLKLDNIYYYDATGIHSSELNSFTYNTSVNLPSRKSAEFDYLGFYNVNSSGSYIYPAANKEPDLVRAQANILTSVKDRSGLITNFTYELNTVYNETSSTNTIVPGLRIAKCIVVNDIDATPLTTTYSYSSDGQRSSGIIGNKLYNVFNRKLYGGFIADGFGCVVTMQSYSSESIYNSFDLNGVFVGYSYIKTINPDNGYKVDEFTNFSEFSDTYAYDRVSPVLSSIKFDQQKQVGFPTSYANRRGLLKRTAAYDKGGNIVKEIIYKRSFLAEEKTYPAALRATPIYWIEGTLQNLEYGYYYFISEDYPVTSTTERCYDITTGTYTEQVTNYTFLFMDPRLVNTVTRNDSKGNSVVNKNYYTSNAVSGGVVTDPAEINAISLLLSDNVAAAQVHSREQVNSGAVKIKHLAYLTRVDYNNVAGVLPGTTTEGYEGKNMYVTQQNQYDVNLNLVGQINDKDPDLAIVKGYNNTQTIAKVENAVVSDIAYTSFETAEQKGGWSFAASGSLAGTAVMGDRFLNLYSAGGISVQSLNTSKKYRLSFWYKSVKPVLSGATVSSDKTLRTSGEWSLVEMIVTSASSLSLTASATSYIDELRLCPADAKMNTYDYVNLIGIRQSCDENNHISKYMYDPYGRLTDITDEDGNIIKHYRYNLYNEISAQ